MQPRSRRCSRSSTIPNFERKKKPTRGELGTTWIVSAPTYERPSQLADAIELMERREARALAGGTDLAVAMRHGKVDPGLIVDLKGIAEMAPRIERSDGFVEISANTVMTDIEGHPHVQTLFPALVEAAQVVGSVQIRNRATLAGNLANASPAADTPPALLALDAEVSVAGREGSRVIPVDDFLVGYRATDLGSSELITAVRLPEPRRPSGSAFLKLGVRKAMEISIVCVAASLTLGADGAITSAGVGLGSVAPRAIRPRSAETILLGNLPSPELFARAGVAAGNESSPIDDLRAGAEYRRAMVPVLVRRALGKALERALAS
jgi:CO/xanthine dehydrogenase FAD-binding subunit